MGEIRYDRNDNAFEGDLFVIKTRGIIFIAAAVLVAFLAAVLVSRFLNRSGSGKVRIVVAGVDIAPGDLLIPEKLKTVKWPASNVPRGTLRDIRKADGRMAASGINAGEIINETRLVPPGESTDEPNRGIPTGMRAVSMEIDRVSGVSGMLHSGDRVDVIATNSLGRKNTARISRVILAGIRVLSVQYGRKGKAASRNGTATLLLSEEDVRALAASEGAKLRLVKRNPSDDTEGAGEATVFSVTLGPKKTSDLERMVAARNKRLQAAIKTGMRAVTIRVHDEDGICGFLRAGNRVDVVGTHPFIQAVVRGKRVPGAEATVVNNWNSSKILMQDVEVLFIEEDLALTGEAQPKKVSGESGDEAMAPDDKAPTSQWATPWPTKRVTLLLSPEDAERLTVIASTSAEVKLIVRKAGDDGVVETSGAKSNEIFFKEKELYYDIEIFGRGTSRGSKRFDRKILAEKEVSHADSRETGRADDI